MLKTFTKLLLLYWYYETVGATANTALLALSKQEMKFYTVL